MSDEQTSAVGSAVRSGFLPVPEPDALRTAHTTANALGTAHATADALGTAHTTAKRTGGFTLPKQRGPESVRGFTLAELVVSVGVLVLFVFLVTQLVNSAATVTTLGQKQMDADSQAREVFDRMALDFAQMVRRPDVDYYVKSNVSGQSPCPSPASLRCVKQTYDDPSRPDPNDQIAFYSAVPGYYNIGSGGSGNPGYTDKSPLSLVAYRVYWPTPPPQPCPSCNRLERMGRGLAWNGFSSGSTWLPILFMPVPLASAIPTPEMPVPAPNPTPAAAFSSAGSNIISWLNPPFGVDWGGEIMGPQVFRFEYYYLLTNGNLSDIPFDQNAGHTGVNGMRDVAAIIVDIAVIDAKSGAFLSYNLPWPQTPLVRQVGLQLIDWGKTSCTGCPTTAQWQTTPGLLRAQWRAALDNMIATGVIPNFNTVVPRPAIQGIRVYERYFYLPSRTR